MYIAVLVDTLDSKAHSILFSEGEADDALLHLIRAFMPLARITSAEFYDGSDGESGENDFLPQSADRVRPRSKFIRGRHIRFSKLSDIEKNVACWCVVPDTAYVQVTECAKPVMTNAAIECNFGEAICGLEKAKAHAVNSRDSMQKRVDELDKHLNELKVAFVSFFLSQPKQ
jgi:hypothetical protein